MQDDKYNPGRSSNRSLLSIYRNWWIWLGSIYAWSALTIISFSDNSIVAPVFGFIKKSEKALLLDMGALIFAPLSIAMWVHLRKLKKKEKELKQGFLNTYRSNRLVVLKHNTLQVYVVIDHNAQGDKVTVSQVWNADGPTPNSTCYITDAKAFSAFDIQRFMKQ